MARLSMKQVVEELKARGIEFDPEAKYNDLSALLKAHEPQEDESVEKAAPVRLISPVRKDAMCGNRTINDHENRIFELEKAVAILQGQEPEGENASGDESS